MAEPAFVIPQEAGNPLPIGEVGRPSGSGIGKTHGTIATYQWGCRCIDCRAAKRLYSRQSKSHQIAVKADRKAARWVRENMPYTWLRLRQEAEDEIDAAASRLSVRNPKGDA